MPIVNCESGLSETTLRHALVDRLKRDGHLRSTRVEAAFRSVPRHRFVPAVPAEEAYRDRAIITKWADGLPVSSSSQPPHVPRAGEFVIPKRWTRLVLDWAVGGSSSATTPSVGPAAR